MAKVVSPRFGPYGDVYCDDCPFSDPDSDSIRCYRPDRLPDCPTAETYAEACKVAEQEASK